MSDTDDPIGKMLRHFLGITKKILRWTYEGFKDLFSGLFTKPKKFITFVVLIIALVIASYQIHLLMFLAPVIAFYIALWYGRPAFERKRKKRIGKIGTFVIFLMSLSIILPCTIGYMIYETSFMKPAHLKKEYLDSGSGNNWEPMDDLTFSAVEEYGLLRLESRGYIYDTGTKPPYMGLVVFVTVKSEPMTSAPFLREKTKDDMEKELEDFLLRLDASDYEGLDLFLNTKQTGERTLKSGHETTYFEYTGKIERSPSEPMLSRFVAGGKVKIRGETWICHESGTVVSAAGVAQYGYTFEPGTFQAGNQYAKTEYPDDQTTWVMVKNQINNGVCH